MLKWLFIILAVVLLGVAGAAWFLLDNLDQAVKTGIERFGPQYLGVAVTVDDVDMSLEDGGGAVTGVRIANPSGFDGDYAMRFDRVVLRIDPGSLLQDGPVVIRELSIDGADVQARQLGLERNNIREIVDYLNAASGTDTADGEPETRYIVDALNFRNGRAILSSDLMERQLQLDVPDINLTAIGRDSGGATAAEIAELIARPLLAAVLDGVRQAGMKAGRERLKDTIRERLGGKDGAGGLLRGLLDGNKP